MQRARGRDDLGQILQVYCAMCHSFGGGDTTCPTVICDDRGSTATSEYIKIELRLDSMIARARLVIAMTPSLLAMEDV